MKTPTVYKGDKQIRKRDKASIAAVISFDPIGMSRVAEIKPVGKDVSVVRQQRLIGLDREMHWDCRQGKQADWDNDDPNQPLHDSLGVKATLLIGIFDDFSGLASVSEVTQQPQCDDPWDGEGRKSGKKHPNHLRRIGYEERVVIREGQEVIGRSQCEKSANYDCNSEEPHARAGDTIRKPFAVI